jgi:hypothetical protein
MKNAVFWDIMTFGSCKCRRFGGTYRLHYRNALLLLVMAHVVPSSPILVTLIMEVLISSNTSVIIRATLRNIPEDGILQRKNILNLFVRATIYFID